MLRNLPRFRVRQIGKCDHGQLIIDISIDGGLKSLPRPIVMNAAMPSPLVDKPPKTVVPLVRLPFLGFDRSPHQLKAGPLEQLSVYSASFHFARSRIEK